MDHITNIYTLKLDYFAYFHHVTKYGIIFRGNSSNTGKIFTLQKKIVRIMANLFIFKKVRYMLASKFSSLPHSLTIFRNEKAKLEVTLRKYLNMHSIYSVDEFLVCKDNL